MPKVFNLPFNVKTAAGATEVKAEQRLRLVGEPPEHEKPDYISQVELHPSPLMVFPSSQARVNLFPSPQISLQTEALVVLSMAETAMENPVTQVVQTVKLEQELQ